MAGMWEHLTAQLQGPDGSPWSTLSVRQREVLRQVEDDGFELVGITTLASGAVLLAYKRPKAVERSPLSHHGVYL